MSGTLQSGEATEEYSISSTDTENGPDDNSVALVSPVKFDLMAPRTRSQSTKSTEACALPLPESNSMSQTPADLSRNNAKRCIEDNQLPMQKRIHHCVDNGLADELQYFNARFRQEREYIDNRYSEIIQRVDNGLRILHEKIRQEKESTDRRSAEERKKLDQKINTLEVMMSNSAERKKLAAEKKTDDTIKSKWDTLRYNIRSVVLMLRSCEPKGAKSTLATLRSRIPNAAFMNSQKSYFREILEGYLEQFIWLFVYKDVFSGYGRQWRGDFFKLVQITRREAISFKRDPKEIAELALWLSRGGEASTSQLDKRLQQTMADEFAETIFTMFQSQPKTVHQAEIKEVLGVVVYDATELALMFMSSKALLFPAWPRDKPFKGNWLDSDFEINHLPSHDSSARFMEIRPALVKFGNADGENHGVYATLCKPARLYF